MAAELGINRHTLMGWRQRVKHGALAPVHVSTTPGGGVVVHGPRGMRVEGLTSSELAELWIRLS